MAYPTFEQYQEALQHPDLALTDPELKRGQVATTGLGLPLALCGGFALTYMVEAGGSKHAIRCFHKQSDALERRYGAIAETLGVLHSPHFVEFEFQPQGVRVNGGVYPVVKMEWASGVTLGEYVERYRRDAQQMTRLGEALRGLATYLAAQKVAHGDIQPGNLMVSPGAQALRLIDYDGMYVEPLRSLGSSELGHRNFQHPGRTKQCWDGSLDRFSFILLDVATRALAARPDLWDKTQSDADGFLLRANDFADPQKSAVFAELARHPQLAEPTRNLASICEAPFESVPTLEDFLAGKGVPRPTIVGVPKPKVAVGYMSAFPVVDGSDYDSCHDFVGERVELIGRIRQVKRGTTQYGKPYVFLNFGDWRGRIVKVTIWSRGLAALNWRPDETWVGRWISVTGLMESPYHSQRYGYTHLSVDVDQGGQLHTIDKSQAEYRLSSVGAAPRDTAAGLTRNEQVLAGMQGGRTKVSGRQGSGTSKKAARTAGAGSVNQQVLRNMKGTSSRTKQPQTRKAPQTAPAAKRDWGCTGCLVVIVVIVLLFIAISALSN